MTSSSQISDLRGVNEIYIFGKHMTRAIQKYNFYLFWTSISKVMAILMQCDHFLAWALTKYGHVM